MFTGAEIRQMGHQFPGKLRGNVFQYDSAGYQIIFFERNIRQSEIDAFHDSQISLGVYVYKSVVFMLVEIPEFIGWSDLPYNYHLVQDDRRQLPVAEFPVEKGAAVQMYLVERSNNIIVGMRMFATSHGFSTVLNHKIIQQSLQPFDLTKHNIEIADARIKYSGEEMAKRAIVTYQTGRK